MRSFYLSILAMLVAGVRLDAAQQPSDRPQSLTVYPPAVKLTSRRDGRQLLVTGLLNGEPRDLTRVARLRSSNERIVKLVGTRAIAVGDGRAEIVVTVAGKSTRIPVVVNGCARRDPVSFKFETLAVLTKQGCASGSCHGSPHGKGGLSLSLFGYDPQIDRISLTRDGYNRRVNVIEPSESLMLKKPLLEMPHGGGKRLRRDTAPYHVVRDWIHEGAEIELPAVACARLVLEPGPQRVLSRRASAPPPSQQLAVLALFSDGTARDVTAIATYESSHPRVVSVDENGLVVGQSRGQAAVSVRYLDRLESVHFTVTEPVPGFRWAEPPDHNFVDRLAHVKLKQLQVAPSGTCSDEVFIRRVYLDLTGMLPPAERAREFLRTNEVRTTRSKRAQLIDELLETEEFARFWALKKADLMRVSPLKLKHGRAELLAQWLTDAVRKNLPYDQFARTLLTASGDAREVATANYFLAIPTNEERTEMSAQLFMGSRLECAKCHNHPFEAWTMRDYYSIAAVFARTRVDAHFVRVVDRGEALHPSTKQLMPPWGTPVAQRDAPGDRRVAFAQWLTRPGNPYFARVEVNRIWSDLMGRGLVEPVDDFRSTNPPSNGPLLDALATEFERSGYDRKQLIRLVCNSVTYQRTTATNRFNETDDSLFSHARPRLLSAEQLKDAIGLATRALAPASTIESRLTLVRSQATARSVELERELPAWLRSTAVAVSRLPLWLGAGYTIGPFSGAEVPRLEMQSVDLTARWHDHHWQLRTDYYDGAPFRIAETPNATFFLYRRVFASVAGTVNVQVQASDAAIVWLNGQRLTPQPLRGNRPVQLALREGMNELLIRLDNGGGEATLTLRAPVGHNLPPHVVEFLAIPAERRTEDQQHRLREAYFESDASLTSLRQQIVRLESRLDYATQRPYPEPSPFMTAFGQPQRETACTCERQSTPTLLQALELLNGSTAHRAAITGAAQYARLEDAALLEELYLSALSRFPNEKERSTALAFLKNANDREGAVMDLVWTVVNTQEFLFQH